MSEHNTDETAVILGGFASQWTAYGSMNRHNIDVIPLMIFVEDSTVKRGMINAKLSKNGLKLHYHPSDADVIKQLDTRRLLIDVHISINGIPKISRQDTIRGIEQMVQEALRSRAFSGICHPPIV
ncbi:MAG: hypothetical protein BWK78_03985 [Thiotrichaceae bacterium IS1]|nr:MAG: hypothetical protein BWK78_03985 [Thiotrichaceae bacterium IS1]